MMAGLLRARADGVDIWPASAGPLSPGSVKQDRATAATSADPRQRFARRRGRWIRVMADSRDVNVQALRGGWAGWLSRARRHRSLGVAASTAGHRASDVAMPQEHPTHSRPALRPIWVRPTPRARLTT